MPEPPPQYFITHPMISTLIEFNYPVFHHSIYKSITPTPAGSVLSGESHDLGGEEMKEENVSALLILLLLLLSRTASESLSSASSASSLSTSPGDGVCPEAGTRVGVDKEEERHRALTDWRTRVNKNQDPNEQGHGSPLAAGEDAWKVLVVDINFGGGLLSRVQIRHPYDHLDRVV
eukprot:763340-Hanusia_phi.AAC.5